METIVNTYLEEIKRLQQSQLELLSEISKNTKTLIALIEDNSDTKSESNTHKAIIIEENY